MESTKLRWVRAVGTTVLALSALVQLNDPDPWRWFGFYGAAALVSGFFPRIRRPLATAGSVGLIALVWLVCLAPRALEDFRLGQLVQTMKAETPAIELGREVLGLLIVVVWMGWLGWLALSTRRASSEPRGESSSAGLSA